jgi:tetrahydromethanopterin S-methyltransferase subunit D
MRFPQICSALFHRLSVHCGREGNCLISAAENLFYSGPLRGRFVVENVAMVRFFFFPPVLQSFSVGDIATLFHIRKYARMCVSYLCKAVAHCPGLITDTVLRFVAFVFIFCTDPLHYTRVCYSAHR